MQSLETKGLGPKQTWVRTFLGEGQEFSNFNDTVALATYNNKFRESIHTYVRSLK